MTWQVKPGEKASEALKEWLEGPTVAECYSGLEAVQLDAVRKAIGDKRFDELYSSHYGPPEAQLLTISGDPSITSPWDQNAVKVKYTIDEEGDVQGLEGGEWGYIYNHPQYLLKHPAGVFQGENAIYMGDNKWSGLGVKPQTEDQMLDTMMRVYNGRRTPRDYWSILAYHSSVSGIGAYDSDKDSEYQQKYEDNLDKISTEYRLESEGGIVREKFRDLEEFIEDGETAYTINGAKREIGHTGTAYKLDPEKIEALRTP